MGQIFPAYRLFMPRSAHVVIANQLHHIIQRGHKRQVVFTQVADYVYYLDSLAEWKKSWGTRFMGTA
jgi:putative transposase